MTFDHNAYITLAVFFILFGIACAVMGYFVGRKHGHDEGYLAGSADEAFHTKGKIIRAKKDGAKAVLDMVKNQGRPVSEIMEDYTRRAFSEYRN